MCSNAVMAAFRTLAWIVCAVYATIPAFWIVAHGLIDRWRESHTRSRSMWSAYRLPLLSWMLFILLSLTATRHWLMKPPYFLKIIPWSLAAVFWTGGVLIYFRIPEFGLGRFLGTTEVAQMPSEVIHTGMHAYVRHPIYLGHLLMLLGWSFSSWSIAVWMLLGLAVITAPIMIRMEEAELVQRYGTAYLDYRDKVPMILPRSVKLFRLPS